MVTKSTFEDAPSTGREEHFRDVLFAYEDSAIMGIQFADGHVAINPPMDTYLVKETKSLVLLRMMIHLIPNCYLL